jgi:hypothetical protein
MRSVAVRRRRRFSEVWLVCSQIGAVGMTNGNCNTAALQVEAMAELREIARQTINHTGATAPIVTQSELRSSGGHVDYCPDYEAYGPD